MKVRFLSIKERLNKLYPHFSTMLLFWWTEICTVAANSCWRHTVQLRQSCQVWKT